MLSNLSKGSKVVCRDGEVREVLFVGIDDRFGVYKDRYRRRSLIYRVRFVGRAGYDWYFENGKVELVGDNEMDMDRIV
jgi:hypothetical protein